MSQGVSLRIAWDVSIPSDDVFLPGEVKVPVGASGIVLFAHGSGSSRFSPRNQSVASSIREAGIGTLLFDLLTEREEEEERLTRHLRFDIDLLTARLVDATLWVRSQPDIRGLRVGYFGSSTGAAAALVAASELSDTIGAIVSRGGRPDLAGESLTRVKAPTLLIVGGADDVVIEVNREALSLLNCVKKLSIVPGATHLFEEQGALESVADLAARWFSEHLSAKRSAESA